MSPKDPAESDARGASAQPRCEERVARGFVATAYDLPRGCAATCFPEANVLVPLGSVADKSGTPTSKSVVITLARSSSDVLNSRRDRTINAARRTAPALPRGGRR